MTLLDPSDISVMHDALTQLSNATLTKIETPGSLAGNGDPGTPVTVWTGAAPGFLERDDKDVLSANVEVFEPATSFRLFDAAGAPAGVLRAGADSAAATVVIVDHRLSPSVTRRWTIVAMTHEQDNTLDSVLLTLNADRPAT